MNKSANSRTKSWLNGWLVLTAVISLGFIAVGAALAFLLPSRPFQSKPLPKEQQELLERLRNAQLGGALNILILGTDIVPAKEANDRGFRAPTDSLDGRSDTVLLSHFDPEARRVNVVSIPRDTRVEIPGFGGHKINVANIYGGPGLAVQTVSNVLGVEINRYVRINPQGVVQLIDALGGVTVYIPRAMKYSDDSQHLYINLPQGWHTLSGLQAQQYLRFRADELGDIGRVQRQQALLRALANKAVKPETIVRAVDIFNIVKRNLDTNLSIEDILSLAQFATQINPKEDLRMVMLPGRFSRAGEYRTSYWLPDERAVNRLRATLFGLDGTVIEPTLAANVRLTIQNATGEPGSARDVRRYLLKQGFRSVDFTNPRPDPIWQTEVVAQGGDAQAAQLVRDALGVGAVQVESTGNLYSDVTIRIGKDWLQRKVQDAS